MCNFKRIIHFLRKILLLSNISAGTWSVPFMILFFRQMGLTPSECSIILGSLPLTNGVFRLIVGAITDKLQRHRETVLLFGIISSILNSCMLLVPPVPKTIIENQLAKKLNKMCNGNGSQTMYCTILRNNVSDSYHLTGFCQENPNHELTMPDCSRFVEDTDAFGNSDRNFVCALFCNVTDFDATVVILGEPFGKTFWTLFAIFFFSYNIYFAIWPLLYGMTYAVLGKERNKFGEQRVWATVGAMITSIASAFALNKYGSHQNDINFTPCFVGFAICANITGISLMFLPVPNMPRNPSMAKDVLALLKQPRIFAMFVVLFVMGFLWGAVETFLFWFLRSLGASSWTLGACLFMGFIAEIPSLYLSGRIIKKIGHVNCLYVALCAYCVRYLGTSLIPSPWWELPFISLRSIVFSVGYTAISVHSSAITPPSMHATLQSMVSATHFGFGKFY